MTLHVDSERMVVALVLVCIAVAVALLGRRGRRASMTRTVLFALCFGAAVALGRSLVLPDTALALFWPAAGIAGLWLLGSPRGVHLQLDVLALSSTTVVVNELLGVPTASALAFGAANLAVGVAVLVVSEVGGLRAGGPGRSGLRQLRDLAVLGAASLTAGLVSAPFGLLASWLATGEVRSDVALSWILRNASGAFLVMVVAMAVGDAALRLASGADVRSLLASRPRPHVVLEAATMVPGSVALTVAVFVPHDAPPLAFLALLGSAYVGSRFAPLVATVHTAVVVAIAVTTTLRGLGPFSVIDDVLLRADVVQAFLLASAAVALTYSMAARERHQLLARLASTEAAVRQHAELLVGVTDGLSAGLLVVEEDGTVVLSNPASAAWAPLAHDRAVALPTIAHLALRDLQGERIQPGQAPHERALATGEVVVAELARRDPVSGRDAVVRVTADPITLVRGLVPRRLVVVRVEDMTVEHTRQRNLESFAGIIAHDLKGPLAAITSWAAVVGDELATAGHREPARGTTWSSVDTGLDRIQSAGTTMNTLIDDLLVFATAGSSELRAADVHLAPMLEEVVALVRDARPEGSPSPWVHVDAPDAVRADPSQVRQVLANVLGNAVKYVAPGVVPHVTVRSRAVGGDTVEIAVEDNGIGIPAEHRRRVFDSFFRAHADQPYSGTGLGLSICAQAVQRHGGTIAAHEGSRGAGTLVVITLPAA
jgi:signal transduction histidine kinase